MNILLKFRFDALSASMQMCRNFLTREGGLLLSPSFSLLRLWHQDCFIRKSLMTRQATGSERQWEPLGQVELMGPLFCETEEVKRKEFVNVRRRNEKNQ